MILPDVNVLIYAFRPEVPQFKTCRIWLEGVLADRAPFGLSSAALGAVVRMRRLEPSVVERLGRALPGEAVPG